MEMFDNEENLLNRLLEEKFQLFQNHEKAPEELEEEVFASLDAISFAVEFAGLFTVKFAQTSMHMIEATIDPKKKK